MSTPSHTLNSGARWDPVTDSWTPTSTTGAPQARTGHYVTWTGNLMIVFTDGRDSQLNQQKADLERVVAEARRWKIPVYMLRTSYNRREG